MMVGSVVDAALWKWRVVDGFDILIVIIFISAVYALVILVVSLLILHDSKCKVKQRLTRDVAAYNLRKLMSAGITDQFTRDRETTTVTLTRSLTS